MSTLEEAYEHTKEYYDTDRNRPYMATKSTMPKSDAPHQVGVPNDYYDAGDIETIKIIKAKLTKEQYVGFLLGNVIKYSSRFNWKGCASQDCAKITKYSQWLGEAQRG